LSRAGATTTAYLAAHGCADTNKKPRMATKQPADEIVGTIDGIALRVAATYDGTLSKSERAAILRSTADYVTDILRMRPEERARGATPEISVVSFRRQLSDLLYLTLNYGFVPVDLAETVRAVGDALGIERAEIRGLIRELRACVERYAEIADDPPDAFAWSRAF
jgi:hypothetical protein